MAVRVLAYLPAEPTVNHLMLELSDDISVSTTPPGADVYLRRLGSSGQERLGLTPIRHLRVARGEFIITIRKAGYAEFERTVSSALRRIGTGKAPWEIQIEETLRDDSKTPRGMSFVPGGWYSLLGWSRVTSARVKLSDYYMDKFEVSNRDFKDFMDAGGYNNRQLWDSQTDVASFRDKTGLPGPRNWMGGTFPGGKSAYPVTAITWLEALAFCRSRGKELPTLFQWEKAARSSMQTPFGVIFPWGPFNAADLAARANFESNGPQPVDAFEFGMSPFGIYQLAGNVREWMRNRFDEGFAVGGGSWEDPVYQFGGYSARSAHQTEETLRLPVRCGR